MKTYAAQLPFDQSGTPLQNFPPPLLPVEENSSHNTAVSSVITLTDSTTVVEIAAGNGDVAMRWVAASDTQASVVVLGVNANFDHIIPTTNVRRFVVPIEKIGVSSVVGANVQNGLYKRIAWMSASANASVYGTEF